MRTRPTKVASSDKAESVAVPSRDLGEADDEISQGRKESLADPSLWLAEYGDYLYACALRYVKDPNIAEEMVQDGLLSAFKAIDSFQQKSSLKTWLGTIVKNKSLDYLRRLGREKKIFAPVQSDEDSALFSNIGRWRDSIPSWGRDPEQALGDKRMQEALTACIGKLSSRQRAIFAMRVLDGESVSEICKTLDISSSNTSVILYRARVQLRACMEETWFEGAEE